MKIEKPFLKSVSYLQQLLMPDACAFCGALLELSDNNASALCEDCLKKWIQLLNGSCPVCGHYLSECNCPVSVDSSADSYHYLVPYGDTFTERLAYTLKRDHIVALENFFAEELAKKVLKLVGAKKENRLLTYPPRSRAGIARYGYDHARRITLKVSALTGIPARSLFKNHGVREQKKLSLKERMQNAESSYRPLTDISSAAGMDIFLLDDVVTTGATSAACTRLLREAGAKTVCCISIFRKL